MISELIAVHAADLAKKFYDTLMEDNHAAAFLQHSVVEERLKPSLERWVLQTFAGTEPFDAENFAERQRVIGEVHARIKLPMHLVLQGASALQQEIAQLIWAAEMPWEERASSLRFVYERMQLAMSSMSQSYVRGIVDRARLEEAYRLFSLDQDVNLEREAQRASLMDWAQSTWFQLLEDGGAALTSLSKAPFGLWIRHRAGVMFEHSPELQSIVRAMAKIDDLMPTLRTTRDGNSSAGVMQLRSAVDEISFLLAEMFQGLSGMESGRDALTRTLNRRFLPSILSREIKFANLHNASLSLFLLDVDHFKSINDRHGHQVGDLVLKRVAQAIGDNIRSSDFLFRYGGEEFLVILVETDLDVAVDIAERVRHSLAANLIEAAGAQFQITASIGVTPHRGHPDPEHLIKVADDALYRAKHAGRDRVEVGIG